MADIDIYFQRERPILAQAVRELYVKVGWWPERTEEQIAAVLERDVAIGAWDGKQLVGFARIISDDCFHAYIEDVMVDPAYQTQGIGGHMLSMLVAEVAHIPTLTLFCSAKLVPFYERQGFRLFPSQQILHWRREDHTGDI